MSQTLPHRLSPSLTHDQGEIHVYLPRLIIKECERETRLQTSLDTFIEGQNSHLLRLSGPQSLDSYRLETSNRLGVNQVLSLTGYVPKIRQTDQRTKLYSEHSWRKDCWRLLRALSPRIIQEKPKTVSMRPQGRQSTTQGKQHRQDQKEGHRYYGGNRRQAIDKLEPVEWERRPTTTHWSRTDGNIRPAAIHWGQLTRSYLPPSRRTTFTRFSHCTKAT